MKWRVWAQNESRLLLIDAPDAVTAAREYTEGERLRFGSTIRVAPLTVVQTFKVGMREVEPS